MAIDLCSEPSSGISPRISFSHDFCLSEFDLQQQQQQPPHPFRSASPGSSIDFDFCVRKSNFDHDPSSSADELFSDGKIIPTAIKTRTPSASATVAVRTKPSLPPPRIEESSSAGKETDDSVSSNHNKREDDDQESNRQQSSSSKSFWRFKRSSSVNCGTGYGRTLCPLPLLSRSNSTGSSTASVKRAPLSRDAAGRHHKQPAPISSEHKKPPLRKFNHGGYGNGASAGVRVSPVLNVPSGNLFGLGSIFFSHSKDKSKGKK